jgi:hypothetical protein
MKVGLLDYVNKVKFPNLPLMKISAYHKARGDDVDWAIPFTHYDRIYCSKVFSDEYETILPYAYDADEVINGGTGFAITVENGREVYDKTKDGELPYEIEHMYPDYSLYPSLTEGKAFGFLTRGCPNCCPFCVVSKKEGKVSVKVADLDEWWRGQKTIVLMDANILACKDKYNLLWQLVNSKARVDFCQGLDARHIDKETAYMLRDIKRKETHFAWDLMQNESKILKGLETFVEIVNPSPSHTSVYILTNYNTTFEQDLYRVRKVQELGLMPDVRVYRKGTAPKITRYLQRWSNNRFVYNSCKDFMDYVPRSDGITIGEMLKGGLL